MEVLGIHFVEGTASTATTSAIIIILFFSFCYGTFRLLRLRWGPYKSLCITFILLHIIPIIALWTIKLIT